MLLVVYRSISTTLIQLFLTFLGLLTARGVVSVLAMHGAFGLTTFAGNILTMLAIAAATDYGIFIFGRYREDRGMGLDRDDSYYATFKSVAPVIVGLRPDDRRRDVLPELRAAALLHHHGRAGRDRHDRGGRDRGHARTRPCCSSAARSGSTNPNVLRRAGSGARVGTAVVRWPAPVFVASLFVVLIGIVAIPGYKPAYNDRYYLPDDAPTNVGFAAADRHFSQARMNPDILMVNADHDMRNPADMLVLNAVARNVMHTEGIAMVQNITRPLGIPIQHSSIPFQTSVQGQTSNMNLPFQRDQLDNMQKMADATQRLDRHHGEAVPTLAQADRAHPGLGGQVAGPARDHRAAARQHRELRRHSSDRCAPTSTGSRTASTSHCAPRRGPCSTPSTASTK